MNATKCSLWMAKELGIISKICTCPTSCDCQNPEEGYTSTWCPVHMDKPDPADDCPVHFQRSVDFDLFHSAKDREKAHILLMEKYGVMIGSWGINGFKSPNYVVKVNGAEIEKDDLVALYEDFKEALFHAILFIMEKKGEFAEIEAY